MITIGSDCHGSSYDRKIDYTPKNIMGLVTDFSFNLAEFYDELSSLMELSD